MTTKERAQVKTLAEERDELASAVKWALDRLAELTTEVPYYSPLRTAGIVEGVREVLNGSLPARAEGGR